MPDQKDDILVEIPDDKLPDLAFLYEKNALWAPYMISLVHMGIKWKKSPKFRNAITFTSPNNTWEQDGTIIAIMTCHCHDIFLFTLDDNRISSLYQGLSQTQIIDWTKRTQFFALHEKYHHIVAKHIREKNLQITYELASCFFMGLPPDQAKTLTFTCPSEVLVKKLDVSAAVQISTAYPHKFPDLQKYVSDFIEINGGYGVFLKSTDELVAWVLKHAFGHVGFLQTEEKYRGRGYGSLLVAALSKELGEEGFWSSMTALMHSPGPLHVFEKLGFRVVNNASFITVQSVS